MSQNLFKTTSKMLGNIFSKILVPVFHFAATTLQRSFAFVENMEQNNIENVFYSLDVSTFQDVTHPIAKSILHCILLLTMG